MKHFLRTIRNFDYQGINVIIEIDRIPVEEVLPPVLIAKRLLTVYKFTKVKKIMKS